MKKRLRFCGTILLSALFFNCIAARVDTVSIYSTAMLTTSKCVVVTPEKYKRNKAKHYPVVYLLHGFSGDYSNWIKKVPEIEAYADKYQMIIVCPDGGYASWYFDSKINKKSQYETYVAIEVPTFIDHNYRTDTSRSKRAITGLSMGGHGAFYLAWKHSDYFGAVATMSGGVDLNESANKYAIEKVIGPYDGNILWREKSIINVVTTTLKNKLLMLIDCGIEDQFLEGNRKLHAQLLKLNIPHDYIERDGGHSWDYWKNSLEFQLLFFHKYFETAH